MHVHAHAHMHAVHAHAPTQQAEQAELRALSSSELVS